MNTSTRFAIGLFLLVATSVVLVVVANRLKWSKAHLQRAFSWIGALWIFLTTVTIFGLPLRVSVFFALPAALVFWLLYPRLSARDFDWMDERDRATKDSSS